MLQDQIVDYIRTHGPVIPATIAKELGKDILIASAMLSELVDNKKLRLTSMKVGGTPLYYFPGDEHKLLSFTNYLNEKDRRTVELLKQKKVLDEEALDPLTRVSLRQLKDFAAPIEVEYSGKVKRLWKLSTLKNEEIQFDVETMLGQVRSGTIEPTEPEKKLEPPKAEQKIERKVEPKVEKTPEAKAVATEVQKAEPERPQTKDLKGEEPHKPKELPIEKGKDPLLHRVEEFFRKNDIEIVSCQPLRRGEIDYTIKVPSPVGRLTYYCRAKDKKKISDGDLSNSYVQGEQKKMPVLYLYTGELTKKALEMGKGLANFSMKKL